MDFFSAFSASSPFFPVSSHFGQQMKLAGGNTILAYSQFFSFSLWGQCSHFHLGAYSSTIFI
jgi:hypothetical protein